MLLPNEPKLMMVPPSTTTSARSSIAVPPMASKATSSLCPPRASRTCSFWMEHAIPEVIGAHFVQRQPRVVKCHAICVNGLAVGIQNHNCLWNKVNDSPQLLFVRKEFGLSELYVTSTGGGPQFLMCGTTGR